MANPHHDVCPNYLLPEFEEAHLLFTVEGKTNAQAAALLRNIWDFNNNKAIETWDCYNSFFFIRRSPFASLPSLRTVLRNAFRLNTASFLHAVHGSLTPFPPTFYGRPSLTCVSSTQLLLIYHTIQAFPLYPPRFLCYEHCLVHVLYSHLFK